MEGTLRKPWLAALLTFAVPGLGHVYAGAARRGIIIYLAGFVAFPVFMMLWGRGSYIAALSVFFLFTAAYFAFSLFDAVRIAAATGDTFTPRHYNRWYIYFVMYVCASILFGIISGPVIRNGFVKAYKIPATSMMNTLLPGDLVLTDRYIYRKSDPRPGDVVIFPYPKNPKKDFVKRVVGVPGDVIEILNKDLYVNNTRFDDEGYAIHLEEVVFPGRRNPRDNFGPITVPEDSVFVLGDNRDNSNDSRFWGPVEMDRVRAKVAAVYWSWDRDNSSVRWGRIGKLVK